VYLREIGAVVAGLMVACVLAPLGMVGGLAAGRLTALQGIALSGGLALMLYLSTQSFVIIWDESPWTRHQNQPFLVGATLFGSVAYSLAAFLAGMLLRGV